MHVIIYTNCINIIGVPYNIDTDAIEKALMDLPDVVLVHNIHVWSLTVDKIAIAVHIAVG